MLVDAGVIRPIRPDKLVKVLTTLARFGRSPAAGTISLAARFPDETMIVDELGTLTFGEVHRAPTRSRTPSPTPGSRRATAWGSCAATTAASSSRPWPCRSSARDALYLNTAFAGPQLTEVAKREKPVAIIYDEEFSGLLAEAGKRRKRFVAWHDSERAGGPHPRRADRERATATTWWRPRARAAWSSSRPGTTGTPKGASRGNPQTLDPAVSLLDTDPAADAARPCTSPRRCSTPGASRTTRSA